MATYSASVRRDEQLLQQLRPFIHLSTHRVHSPAFSVHRLFIVLSLPDPTTPQ